MRKKEGVHGEQGMHVERGHAWWGAFMVGGIHGGGHSWWGACMAGEMATAADGTHPAGMHSCYVFVFECFESMLQFSHQPTIQPPTIAPSSVH